MRLAAKGFVSRSSATLRISSNYVRLLLGVVLGVLLARLLLGELGSDGFGLIALLGSTLGLAAMVQEVVRASLIRELGTAFHDPDPRRFQSVYHSASALSLLAGMLSAGLFVLLILFLPFLDIPDQLQAASRWFILAKAGQTLVVVALSPQINLYVIQERMVAENSRLVLDRLADYLAALSLLASSDMSVGSGVVLYGGVSSGLHILIAFGYASVMMCSASDLWPCLRKATVREIISIIGVGGWNVASVLAMNLHIRADAVLMNLWFGIFGNLVFGLATQLTSYARMITTGMTGGLDAVAARVSSNSRDDTGVWRLMSQSTRLHGIVALPWAGFIFILAGPLLNAWVGARLNNAEQTIPVVVGVIRVLAVGIAVRSVSDAWMRILYGAGFIRSYAPAVLIGGLINPLIAILLFSFVPQRYRLLSPALAFSGVMLIVHGLVLPWIAARLMAQTLIQVYAPLARPMAIALVMVSGLWGISRWVHLGSALSILCVTAIYAIIFIILAFLFGLEAKERSRLLGRVIKVK